MSSQNDSQAPSAASSDFATDEELEEFQEPEELRKEGERIRSLMADWDKRAKAMEKKNKLAATLEKKKMPAATLEKKKNQPASHSRTSSVAQSATPSPPPRKRRRAGRRSQSQKRAKVGTFPYFPDAVIDVFFFRPPLVIPARQLSQTGLKYVFFVHGVCVQYLMITQPCSFCARTNKRCVTADPHNDNSPCRSCRLAKTKCSWVRKITKPSKPPGSDDATPSLETPSNPPPPVVVSENAVAGSSSIRPATVAPPHLSAADPRFHHIIAYHNDINDSIDNYIAICKANVSLLGKQIAPLSAKITDAAREATEIGKLFSDTYS